jgi:hypothetical protein
VAKNASRTAMAKPSTAQNARPTALGFKTSSLNGA